MLAEHGRFERQLDLAAKHLALHRVLDIEAEAVQAMADRHGVTVLDATERRRLAYRGAIIETYAALEDFVMDAASAYAGALRHVVTSFADLPERIQTHNFELTLRVLGHRDRKPWRDRVDVDEMLDRLLQCIRKPSTYQLNEMVFREHTANFRAELVDSFFLRLDVELSRHIDLADADKFVVGESPLGGLVKDVRGAVDLLADRRNEIAHGCSDTDTLSHDILVALVKVIRLYGGALQMALLDAIATRAADGLDVFGRVEQVFHQPTKGDGLIAGVRVTRGGLSVKANDWVVFRRKDGIAILVRSRSIHVNRVAVEQWTGGAGPDELGGVWIERPVAVDWELCPAPAALRRALGLAYGDDTLSANSTPVAGETEGTEGESV